MIKIRSESVVTKLGDVLMDTIITKEDGISIRKKLQLEDYINVLKSGSFYKKEEYFSPGIIPRSVVDISMDMVTGKKYEVTMIFPKGKNQFKISGGKTYAALPFPTLLYRVSVDDGKFFKSSLFALKGNGDDFNPETKLYRYPFGNVGADGTMCYGNAGHSKIEAISECETLFYDFLFAATNGHYYHPGETNLSPAKSQNEFVEELSKMDSFPDEVLAEAQIKTYKDLKR